jgi:uncharacterized damage-inducible protein DinB
MKNSILLAVIAAVLIASTRGHGAPPSGVATAKEQWTPVIKYITTAAEQMPEAKYAYRPVGTVRTFGQLIGHLAGTQELICGSALGEKTGGEDDIEKSTTTKAGLVAALKKSTEHCEKAYAMSDADAGATHPLFGADRTALWGLIQNAVHDSEHYGNIVTYMRMMNMVPPSSQPTAR